METRTESETQAQDAQRKAQVEARKLYDEALVRADQVDKEAIKHFLGTLQNPLNYLDFETISPVVPMYDGTRPYQRIPFQFSMHIVSDEHSRALHHSFLADGSDDPRPKLLSELKRVLRDTGSMVVYNQSFEKGVLLELAEAFPEFAEWLHSVCDRLIDLYAPFRDFHYYSPRQCGSASIKEVLPAVTGRGYEGMSIARGDDASLAFLRLTCDDVSVEEREQLRADLEKYCGLDTEGESFDPEYPAILRRNTRSI